MPSFGKKKQDKSLALGANSAYQVAESQDLQITITPLKLLSFSS